MVAWTDEHSGPSDTCSDIKNRTLICGPGTLRGDSALSLRWFSPVIWTSNYCSIDLSDQLLADLDRSPKISTQPCQRLPCFSCLDMLINSWMIAHYKFLMGDFEIGKGGKQLRFMAWSYSINWRGGLKGQPCSPIGPLAALAPTVKQTKNISPRLPALLFPCEPYSIPLWASAYDYQESMTFKWDVNDWGLSIHYYN